MNVCLIPARGGSKRIPRKNVRPFLGRPMIAWAIATARDSGVFGRIVVSTDDEEIRRTAIDNGADVPFMRPAELANDFATTVAVVAHAVGALALSHEHDRVCCLYATTPLLRPEDLVAGLDVLQADLAASYAVSVTRFAYPIERALRLTPNRRLTLNDPAMMAVRSQDLIESYHDAGQFYWGRAAAFARAEPLLGPGAAAVVLPAWRVVDIDTVEDWERAERLAAIEARQGSA